MLQVDGGCKLQGFSLAYWALNFGQNCSCKLQLVHVHLSLGDVHQDCTVHVHLDSFQGEMCCFFKWNSFKYGFNALLHHVH